MDKNDELFKGTSFADLMSDVYHNSKKKDRQINQLIAQLQPLIKNASDATIIVPLIKEYLDVAVKNDDHLVKQYLIKLSSPSATKIVKTEKVTMCLYPNCFQCYSSVADGEVQGTNSTPIMIPGAKKQRPDSAGYKSKVGS